MMTEYIKGNIEEKGLTSFLLLRDKQLSLEFEASNFLYRAVPILESSFPNAKFIFTVREPLSWLESKVNQSIKGRNRKDWRGYDDTLCSKYEKKYVNKDLKKHGLQPLKSYLRYWSNHVGYVCEKIPKEKIVKVDTFKIKKELKSIANFIGAKKDFLDLKRAHSGVRDENRFSIGKDVSKSRVVEDIKEVCIPTIENYLPKLKSSMDYV
jgi:hypothetical protein